MKKIILFLPLLFLGFLSFAQETRTEKVSIPGMEDPYRATLKYEYTLNNEGNPVKNGEATVKGWCKRQYENYSDTCSYYLSASFKDGLLNGPIQISDYSFSTEKFPDISFVVGLLGQNSLSGSFVNNIPDGEFHVKFYFRNFQGGYYSDSYTIMFDHGELNSFHHSTQPAFREYEYLNNVLIWESSLNEQTPEEQKELAIQYANGDIDENMLLSKGYIVKNGDFSSYSDSIDDLFTRSFYNWPEFLDTKVSIPQIDTQYRYLEPVGETVQQETKVINN